MTDLSQSSPQAADTPPCIPAGRFVETLRRLILLAGVLGGLWVLLTPAQALLRVDTVDFAKVQKAKARTFGRDLAMMEREMGKPIDRSLNTAARTPPEQFVAAQTAGRLVRVQGQAWGSFADAVGQTLTGQSTVFSPSLSDDYGGYNLYFRPDTPPLDELASAIGDEKPFTYVAVEEGGRTRYLQVVYQRPSDFTRHAPARLAYPMRQHAVWFLVAGLLGYALLPWHRKAPNELRYSTARAIVVPDLLGTAMAAFFFALPILIVTANMRSSRPVQLLDFEDGWGILTLVMWGFAAGGLSIVFVALRYATTSIFLLDDRIRRASLGGAWECRFDEISAIEPAILCTPRWLRVLLLIGGLFNWRLMAQALLVNSRQSPGLRLCCRDGRRRTIWFESMDGFDRVFGALRRAEVPMDPDLAESVDEDLAGAPDSAPKPTGKAGRVVGWTLLVLAVGTALGLHFRPEPERTVQRRLRFTKEAMDQRSMLLDQMKTLSESMRRVTSSHRSPGANPRQQAEAMAEFDRLLKQHQDLENRYNAIRPTEDE